MSIVLAALACGGGGPVQPPGSVILSVAQGDGQTGEPSRHLAQALLAMVTSRSGIPVASARVTFEVTAGGGGLLATPGGFGPATLSTTTDQAGLARALWRLGTDTTAPQTVRVTTPGASMALVISASAVSRVFVRALSGLGQDVQAGSTHRMTAEAYDSDGLVVPGARIRWQVIESASTIVLADTIADASGRASANLVAATVTGRSRVSAVAKSGAALFTNTIAPADVATLIPTPAHVILPMEGNVVPLKVAGFDRFSNDIPDIDVALTIGDTTIAIDWGSNRIRAVTAGTTYARLRSGAVTLDVPVTVMSFSKVYVVAGIPCGITPQGSAYCWNTGIDTVDLVRQSLLTIAQLAYQGDVECLLAVTGTAQCWGPSGSGALGGGPGITPIVRTIDDPVTVLGGPVWTQLSAGLGHVCGLVADGEAFCWGISHLLGTDSTTAGCMFGACASSPVPVKGGLRFRSLVSVRLFTCGIEMSEDAYCWGQEEHGELGSQPTSTCPDGEFRCARFPQLVRGGHKWLSLATGFNHACGLATDGEAYCWGSNDIGQLGTNSVPPDSSNLPLRVGGGFSFQSISAGGNQTCGLTTAGKAYCWGSRQTTAPTPARPNLTFTSIVTSNWADDVACGISATGGVHCWYPSGMPATRIATRMRARLNKVRHH